MAITTYTCLICNGAGKVNIACGIKQSLTKEFKKCEICNGLGYLKIVINPYVHTGRNKRWGINCEE